MTNLLPMNVDSDAASPPSVRKGYAFPKPSFRISPRLSLGEDNYKKQAGKAKPYRTESG
ncbi:MAG TPA: hypothetical protein VIW64_18315 [Pyrinomonadaceae bacterium]|jgi:hypothetical protein